MDVLRKTLEQFWKFFQELPPSQRVSVAAAVLIVGGALGYLVYRGTVPDEEALLAGKQFSAEELTAAQESLRTAGMKDFRVDAMKIYVSRAQASTYNAALIEHGAIPAHLDSELANLHKNLNPFLSNQQRQEQIEAAQARELCKMFRAMQDVQDAQLVWKANRERGLYGSTKTTATLSVKPKPGRSISSQLAHSLQRAVASGLNMSPEDVTVLDPSGKMHHGPEADDPYRSEILERKREFTEVFQKQIQQALQHIPHVIVAVNVELDTLRSSREQTIKYGKSLPLRSTETEESDETTQAAPSRQPGVVSNAPGSVTQAGGNQNDRRLKKSASSSENVPAEQTVQNRDFDSLPLKSAQATVSIPEEYFQQIALKQEPTADATKLQVLAKQVRDTKLLEIQKTVQALLPPPLPPAKVDDLVKVTTYDRLDTEPVTASLPLTAMLQELALQYGGPAALCLFALWALFSLQRSLPKPPPEPAPVPGKSKPGAVTSEDEEADEEATRKNQRDATPRDKLQTVVRDNPEMAAAVLERWIKTMSR